MAFCTNVAKMSIYTFFFVSVACQAENRDLKDMNNYNLSFSMIILNKCSRRRLKSSILGDYLETTMSIYTNQTAYGGSWADDDIDMASISVPIERPSHFHSLYSGDSFYSGGSGNFSRGGGNDPGPPYIAKMVNLPVTASDSFIEDLFKSRFTTFVKFKIVVDPSSNILETHIIKKVAFVELESFGDLQKVLKWVDLYYKANRKVIVEQADFLDFQHCINFNKTKAQEIDKIQQEFLSNKQFGHGFPDQDDGPHARHAFPRSPLRSHQPLHSTPPLRRPSFGANHLSNAPPLVAPKNKANPFGTAKPVDVLSKQQEIEKKLINLNGTTAQTLGPDGEPGDVETTIKKFHEAANPRRNSFNSTRRASQSTPRRPSVSILKRISVPDSLPKEDEPPKSPLSSAPPPPSVYGTNGTGGGRSLAELLSAKPNDFKESTPGARNSPATSKAPIVKPQVSKAVVLKKKIPSPPLTKAELATAPKVQEEKERFDKVSTEKELEIEDKLKKINESLSHSDLLENTTETTTSSLPGASTTTSIPPKTVKNGKKEPPSAKVENGSTDKVPARPFDDDRPDFKKHLNELVKKPYVPKEKRPHQPNKSHFRGNYLNVGRRNYNNSNASHIQSSGDPTAKRADGTDRRPTPSHYEAGNSDEKFRPRNQSNPRNQGNIQSGRSRSPTKSKNKIYSKLNRGPNSSNSSLPELVLDTSKAPISDIQHNGKQNEKRKEAVKEAKGNVEPINLQPKAVREVDSARLETERSENDNPTDSSSSNTRGRGRGGARGRGSSRGKRGRGRGGATNSFNLHYVRPKTSDESKPVPSPSL
jgi:hypothetical protein